MSMWNVANCSSKKLDWQFWQISANTYSSCHPCVSFVSNIIDKCQKFDRQQRATISIQFMVFFSVIKVYERQQILENSIGALPEEHEAYNTLLILTATCVPGLFIATVLQFLSYYCFNRFFHPFKDILSGLKRGKAILTKFELYSISIHFVSQSKSRCRNPKIPEPFNHPKIHGITNFLFWKINMIQAFWLSKTVLLLLLLFYLFISIQNSNPGRVSKRINFQVGHFSIMPSH